MKITLSVSIDVDLDAFRDEYGDDDLTRLQIREHIASDVRAGLEASPYAHSIRALQVK